MEMKNVLLGDRTTRLLLRQIDDLTKGSAFEKETIDLFVEMSLRARFGLDYDSTYKTKIVEACKTEVAKAFPKASETELNELANARTGQILALAVKLVNRIDDISKALIKEMDAHIAKQREELTKELDNYINTLDAKIEQKFNDKIAALPETIQKAVLIDMFGEKIAKEVMEQPVHRSDLKRELKKIGGVV